MEKRLEKLEEKLVSIQVILAAIGVNQTTMGKTLEALADVRAETLHIVKQQVQVEKEHDEIFTRLRTAEAGRAACDEKHKIAKTRIGKLESNQKWGVVAIIGSVISYAFKKLFL